MKTLGKATNYYLKWQAVKILAIITAIIGLIWFTLSIFEADESRALFGSSLLTSLAILAFWSISLIILTGADGIRYFKFLRDLKFVEKSQYSHILGYMLIPYHHTLSLTSETKSAISELALIIRNDEKTRLADLQYYLDYHLKNHTQVKAYIDSYANFSSKENKFIYSEIKRDVNRLNGIGVDFLSGIENNRKANEVSSILNKHTSQ